MACQRFWRGFHQLLRTGLPKNMAVESRHPQEPRSDGPRCDVHREGSDPAAGHLRGSGSAGSRLSEEPVAK